MDNGRMAKSKATAFSITEMVIFTRVNGRKEKGTATVFSTSKTEVFLRASGQTTK